ncbi:MAG TPA: GxxExxY protein [Isosphaeraceae bacterium]|jgi:GxxExxY protein|nr:GxxExxY protein [Isosphaeraceae bacterium]
MEEPLGYDDIQKKVNELSHQVVGAAIEVHRHLGPGLLESAYEECVCRELHLRHIPYERQVPVQVEYKGILLDCGYRIDILAGGLIVIELKAVESLEPIHEAQLLTYLRLRKLWLGLLINFNVPILKSGVKRRVNGDPF